MDPPVIPTLDFLHLAVCFLPVAVVIAVLHRWSLGSGKAIYAMVRMLIQLLLIGYALVYIFETESPWIVMGVLAVMLMAASWIALQPLARRSGPLYLKALLSILIGGVTTLLLVTQAALQLEPWFAPRYCIPLAGMIFANSMNAVSLAAERLDAELAEKKPYEDARRVAMRSALIPVINSLFAVGLVSLPGMMTGQILSGISPHIAVRYQVMVMCMIFGAAGLSAACFLVLAKPHE